MAQKSSWTTERKSNPYELGQNINHKLQLACFQEKKCLLNIPVGWNNKQLIAVSSQKNWPCKNWTSGTLTYQKYGLHFIQGRITIHLLNFKLLFKTKRLSAAPVKTNRIALISDIFGNAVMNTSVSGLNETLSL